MVLWRATAQNKAAVDAANFVLRDSNVDAYVC